MPALPSFMALPRRSSKLKGLKSPPRRLDSPSSASHPYASPDAVDIRSDGQPSERSANTLSSGGRTAESVQMKLDIHLSPESTNWWYPEHLFPKNGSAALKSTGSNPPPRHESPDDTSEEEPSFYDYYDETSTASDDIVANLEALDASNFLNMSPDDESGGTAAHATPHKSNKTPPPIKIPGAMFRGAKVQLVHSSASPQGRRTRPNSLISMDEMSAVSGSTLARALMGNSFVLSSDTTSRHRSISSLVRMDSATLPKGENPFLSSPIIRDRTLSWANSSATHEDVPPVPPIPTNADIVYSPPVHLREDEKPAGLGSRLEISTEPPFISASVMTLNEHTFSAPLQRIGEVSPTDSERTSEYTHDMSAESTSRPVSTSLPNNSRHNSSGNSSLNQQMTPLTSVSNTTDKEIGGVLSYYEHTVIPSPEMENGFKPAFSPITEETTSQLSPPTSGWDTRSVALSSGVSFGVGRVEWLTRRESLRSNKSQGENAGNRVSLLPIGGRPRSDASSASLYSTSSATPSSSDIPSPLPPPPRGIFNRERPGSTPSPIRVVRDSRDLNAYNIRSPCGSSPSADGAGSAEYARQTFPETPDLFSPTFTAEMDHGGQSGAHDNAPADVPETPSSSAMPSFSQQVLMARAASGARLSRQGNMIRPRTVARTSSLSAIPRQVIQEEPENVVASTSTSPPRSIRDSEPLSPFPRIPTPRANPSKRHTSLYNSLNPPPHLPKGLPNLPASPTDSVSSPLPHSASSSGSEPPPSSPAIVVSRPETTTPVVPPPPQMPPPLPPISEERRRPPPILASPPPSPLPIPPSPSPSASTPQSQRRYPVDPIGVDRGSNTYSVSMGSPPPYYTVMYDHVDTPSTGSPGHDTERRFVPRQSMNSIFSNGDSSASVARRRTTRAPAGPRGPARERNVSMSSFTLTQTPTSRRNVSVSLPSPRFQTPAPKWRGYTLDAAKWTFTSAQLQEIVSHAIRQSAESSSIRLLRQKTADVDIPEEIDRLEKRRTDVKTKYKLNARRRTELLESLTYSVSDSSGLGLRLVEELKDVVVSLDKLAEELHSIDEQVSQLHSLVEVHSASALAMALRKLNTSFLKEFAHARALREQIQNLEVERDDAWQHAEDATRDLEQMSRSASPDSGSIRKRSSQASARRKSSIRASRAGLRSSVISNYRLSSSTYSGAKSVFSDIPPVPPIPRRPRDINTDLPTRSSMGLSSDGYTPSSETRAMMRAHEELCEMLGITMQDTRPKRSRSLIVPSSANTSAGAFPVEIVVKSPPPPQRRERPTSMPDHSRMSEARTAFTIDRTAMLATLEMFGD